MRLSPRDPYIGVFHLSRATRSSTSAISTRRSTNFTRRSTRVFAPIFVYAHLSAAYAQAGKMDEAKAALAEARRLNPKLTVKWMIEHSRNTPAVSTACARRGCRRSERAQPAAIARAKVACRLRREQPQSPDKLVRPKPIEHAPKASRARFSFTVFQNHAMLPSFGQKRSPVGGITTRRTWLILGQRGGERRSPSRRIGAGIKNTPRGPRKSLKRLVPDKEIKVNSKENPRTFQTIPRIFQGNSKKSKDFQGMRRRRDAAASGDGRQLGKREFYDFCL